MKILIIGAGALGMLFGAHLARENNVTFLTRREEQAEQLRSQGGTVYLESGERCHFFPHACTWTTHPASFDYDFILITTKQYHLADFLPRIHTYISKTTPLLFVLNGLGHIELISSTLAEHHVYTGITQRGALKQADGSVKENGNGGLVFGPVFPSSATLNEAVSHPKAAAFMEECSKQGIHPIFTLAIEQEMLKKCIINACINPLTALFQVRNGQLVQNDRLLAMMKKSFQEMILLLHQKGGTAALGLGHEEELWEEIIKVCRNTSNNKSSMLQDFENKRKTEIQAITGYFLSLASAAQVSMPYNQFLYEAIQVLESSYS